MSFVPRVIMCATCNQPCQRIEQFTFWEDTPRATIRIRVHCHGKTEEVDLMVSELCSAPQSSVEFTAAFVTPRALMPWPKPE